MRQAETDQIASNIGKSAAFVTQHAALLDLTEPIALAFNEGRVRDVTIVNELDTAYKSHPARLRAGCARANRK